MISEEEAKKIKQEIIEQIDSWHATEEQKEQAKKQISDLTNEQLEEFLVKNKMIKSQESSEKQECPFCLIIQNKIHSYKIDENKESIAVLEINPLSEGHTIIIPKKHMQEIPKQALSLANKIAKKLKSKLKAEEVKIETSNIHGHSIVNLIPVYKDVKLERKKTSQEELKELQEKLTTKKKPKTTIVREKKSKQLEKAPIRIP